jgi:hypothetical protein
MVVRRAQTAFAATILPYVREAVVTSSSATCRGASDGEGDVAEVGDKAQPEQQ